MTEDKKAGRRLALRRPGHAGYEVGYGKPPARFRFRKGQSGNPGGRPKGSKNKLAGAPEERLKSIVMQEAYRQIRVRDGDKTISVPVAAAVVRALSVSGAKGNNRAAQLFTQMIQTIEERAKQQHWDTFVTYANYKENWGKELRRREQSGIAAPEPVPHPDDIILNSKTGDVRIRGPLIEADKDWWLLAHLVKDQLRKSVSRGERQLRRHPDHSNRATFRRDVDANKHYLSRLEECYPDSVTERVVRSRTDPDGEIEFAYPEAILKLVRNAE